MERVEQANISKHLKYKGYIRYFFFHSGITTCCDWIVVLNNNNNNRKKSVEQGAIDEQIVPLNIDCLWIATCYNSMYN